MFKSNLKALMELKKVTFRELEQASGISRQTLSDARTDSGIAKCRLSTLGRIAQALGVGTKDLFGGEYQPPEG